MYGFTETEQDEIQALCAQMEQEEQANEAYPPLSIGPHAGATGKSFIIMFLDAVASGVLELHLGYLCAGGGHCILRFCGRIDIFLGTWKHLAWGVGLRI